MFLASKKIRRLASFCHPQFSYKYTVIWKKLQYYANRKLPCDKDFNERFEYLLIAVFISCLYVVLR